MRAAVLCHFNEPWDIRQVPEPRPEAGQVLIRVRASGICATDLHVHHGYFALPTPFVAGHEPVGEVVELGSGVTSLRRGDRVGVRWSQKSCGRCPTCRAGREAECPHARSWMDLGGGNAELMLAWAEGCTLLPEGIDDATAAPLLCAGEAAVGALRRAGPRPGERVAVLGIGAVGHLALQISRAAGLETFAITGQADKKAALEAMGADEVVVAQDDPGERLAAAGGADVILSTTDSLRQVESAARALRPGGRLVSMGLTDGPTGQWCVAPDRALHASLLEQPLKPLDLARVPRPGRGPRDEPAQVEEALRLAAAGKLKPLVETYPLEQANAVLDRLAARAVRYSAVLLHRA